jgi:hypothetical protein
MAFNTSPPSPSNATTITTFQTRLTTLLITITATPGYLSRNPTFPPSPADLELMNPRTLLSSIFQVWSGSFSSTGWLTNNPSNSRDVTWNKKQVDKIVGGLKAAEDDLVRLDELPGVLTLRLFL